MSVHGIITAMIIIAPFCIIIEIIKQRRRVKLEKDVEQIMRKQQFRDIANLYLASFKAVDNNELTYEDITLVLKHKYQNDADWKTFINIRYKNNRPEFAQHPTLWSDLNA